MNILLRQFYAGANLHMQLGRLPALSKANEWKMLKILNVIKRYCPTTGNRGRKWYQSIDNFKMPGRPFSFLILKGHHHKRSIKPSSASSQQLN